MKAVKIILAVLVCGSFFTLASNAQRKTRNTKSAVQTQTQTQTSTQVANNQSGEQEKTVKYFYDENWKGVQSEDFATYVRHLYYSTDSHFPNRFIDYIKTTGTKCSEGTFVSIDKYDDSNSVFIDGKTYYPSGRLQLEFKVVNGNKETITYYENGNKQAEATLNRNGKMDGLAKIYSENGRGWSELFYRNGELDMSRGTYTSKTVDGESTTLEIGTNKKLSLEAPTAADMSQEFNNGDVWTEYKKNGILVGVCADRSVDYNGSSSFFSSFWSGKSSNTKEFLRIRVVIQNNSAAPLIFDPNTIIAKDISKKKPKDIEFISYSEYTKKVDDAQNESLANKSAAEKQKAKEMATTSSGFSSAAGGSQGSSSGRSSSNTNSTLNGSSGYSAAAGSIGSNGVSAAAAGGYSNINGNYNSNSSSKYNSQYSSGYSSSSGYETRDANVYRQGMQEAENKINSYSDALQEENQKKREMYMKPTQIGPFETYIGYVYTKQTKIQKISYDITLEGIVYPFTINVNDNHN